MVVDDDAKDIIHALIIELFVSDVLRLRTAISDADRAERPALMAELAEQEATLARCEAALSPATLH